MIPPGTVLDTADWEWEGLALPRPPPIDAVLCLDQAAYDEMVEDYELYGFRILTSRRFKSEVQQGSIDGMAE